MRSTGKVWRFDGSNYIVQYGSEIVSTSGSPKVVGTSQNTLKETHARLTDEKDRQD